MKEVTVVLEDDALSTAVEAEAAGSGRRIQDIVPEALQQWLADGALDEEEQAEIDMVRKEWRERGT